MILNIQKSIRMISRSLILQIVFRNYYNLIESFWITREKVEEDFLTNNEIEAIREIENLLETVKEIIFEQDEDDANMRRFILNQFTHLMYLINPYRYCQKPVMQMTLS